MKYYFAITHYKPNPITINTKPKTPRRRIPITESKHLMGLIVSNCSIVVCSAQYNLFKIPSPFKFFFTPMFVTIIKVSFL